MGKQMSTTPILSGIDLSSDKRNCAIAEGEPAEVAAGTAELTVKIVQDKVQSTDDEEGAVTSSESLCWGLEPVRLYLKELSDRCKEERRQAVVAVDVPFGYPDRFRQYIENPLTAINEDSRREGSIESGKNPVDVHLYRVCELQLMDLLRYSEKDEKFLATQPHKPLWDYYKGLKKSYPNVDGKSAGKASPGWNTRPLCTVGSWLSVNVVKWMRLCADLGATVLAPSVWRLPSEIYLIECYPAATQVMSGFWHPRLKAGKSDCKTRCAAEALLKKGKIRLDAGKPVVDLRPWWGVVDTGTADITSTDHRFDAFTALLTAWWLGKHLSHLHASVSINDYPSPPKATIHPSSFGSAPSDPSNECTNGEGTIYFPAIPTVMLKTAC